MEKIEVVFSFDTTGSMSPCIGEVRKNVEAAFTPMFKEMPNLKIGVVAHGDYCDRRSSYVTQWKELTNNLYDLCQFVRGVRPTGGGDMPECYELVLHEAQNINWSLDSKKILVLIGDSTPHEPSYPENTLKLDWRKEAEKLKAMGVVAYTVQALGRSYASSFYSEVARITSGYHLKLNQFTEVVDLIMAIALKQSTNLDALKQWEENLVSSRRMSRSLDDSIRTLTGRVSTPSRYDSYGTSGLVPVAPGRFQILTVDKDIDIRGFVEENHLIFKIGRGFYQFTKTEEIQEKKEVVLRDKYTGDMFTGNEARNMIGVPMGTRGRLRPADLGKYDIFVQSTSVNRKLKGGTKFLYEVPEDI